jgi:excisionase family DNA binding protein
MQLYTEGDAARTLNCSKATLRRMRREHRGPRWTRVGRLIRYPVSWLREYVERNAGDSATGAQGQF